MQYGSSTNTLYVFPTHTPIATQIHTQNEHCSTPHHSTRHAAIPISPPTPTPIYCHTHTRRYHPPAHLHHVNTPHPLPSANRRPQRHTATPCPATMAPDRPPVTPRPFVRTERSPSPRPDAPAEATLTGGSPGPTAERADLGTPAGPCTLPHASRTAPRHRRTKRLGSCRAPPSLPPAPRHARRKHSPLTPRTLRTLRTPPTPNPRAFFLGALSARIPRGIVYTHTPPPNPHHRAAHTPARVSPPVLRGASPWHSARGQGPRAMARDSL